jgi:hypothetical protein
MGRQISGPGLLHFADGSNQPFLGLDARGIYVQRSLIRTWAPLSLQDGATPHSLAWRDLQILEITDGVIDELGAMDGHLQVVTTAGAVRTSSFGGFVSVDAYVPDPAGRVLGHRSQVGFAAPSGSAWHAHLRRIVFAPSNAV